jgi:hypothetical protein
MFQTISDSVTPAGTALRAPDVFVSQTACCGILNCPISAAVPATKQSAVGPPALPLRSGFQSVFPLPLSMFRTLSRFPCTHEQLLLLQLYSPRPCHVLGRDRAMLLETVGETFVHTCLTSLTWEDPVRRCSSCGLPAREPLDPMRSGRSPYTGHKGALPMMRSPLLVTL